MVTVLLLLACGQPEPKPVYVPPPDLILNGRNIQETLPAHGRPDILEFDDCPVADIKESLGWPQEYYDDGGMGWNMFSPQEWALQVKPHPTSHDGCIVKIYAWDKRK